MADELTGNVLVAQSGGPTAVINSSLAGVVNEALNHECIEEIYGGLNGIVGVMQEELIDLADESQQTIRALRHTPGAALGTCRYKVKKQPDFERILQVFDAHNIRYFFYIGGNDSQDTVHSISEYAAEHDYPLRTIGIPKTIDNDLMGTDHCPGYGSVIKYISTTVREISHDSAAMGQHDLVQILEVMGRSSGWIAAGAALAKRRDVPNDPPHLIYLPEVAFSEDKLIEDVSRVLKRERFCFIVVGEGLVDSNGNFVTVSTATDAFGHGQLGGVSDYLKRVLEERLAIKVRTNKPGFAQRAAAHCSSLTDNNEAYLAGQAAVQAAVEGQSAKMVTLLRGETDFYSCETGLAKVTEVANGVKSLPTNWINEDGVSMNYQFLKYALPLIQGEVAVPFENGVPKFAHLSRSKVAKVLDPYALTV